MRRLILLILALATLLPISADAYDVLILQSKRTPANDEVLKGFGFDRKTSRRMLVMSDYAEFDLMRIVREDKPRLILALGDSAVKAARKVQNTPVVAAMSLAITENGVKSDNFSGISMIASPDYYLGQFQKMNKRRIGLIYNPAKNSWYVKQVLKSATEAGIELVLREVFTPREAVNTLSSLTGKVDAFWMLPDTTAVTRETVEAYFLFTQQHNIPLVSFAKPYLGIGAAAVIEVDNVETGRQADHMAQQILSGGAVPTGITMPAKATVRTNQTILNRLGLSTL